MQVIEKFVGILAFIAIAILILGLVRDSHGTARVLNSIWSGLNSSYDREIAAAGHTGHR